MNFFHSQLHSCSCKLCKLPQLPQVDADTRVTVASLSCQLPKRSRQTAVRSACQDSQYANASSSLASYQCIDPLLPLVLPPSISLSLSLSRSLSCSVLFCLALLLTPSVIWFWLNWLKMFLCLQNTRAGLDKEINAVGTINQKDIISK